jgi:RNA polymerase sigma-70 factor, ECF subfamily
LIGLRLVGPTGNTRLGRGGFAAFRSTQRRPAENDSGAETDRPPARIRHRLAVTRLETSPQPGPVPEIAPLRDDDDKDRRHAANAAMERYAAGDDAAFAELYDALAPRLHQFLTRHTRDTARAEDLLQQTLLQIHGARGRFLAGADVFPWAFAIARRLFIDGLRRGRHEVVADTSSPDTTYEAALDIPAADDLLHSKRIAQTVARELARIPEPHRVAFELVKTEGLSMREAAAVLGTTVTAVKLRAHRAYVALRAALTEAN